MWAPGLQKCHWLALALFCLDVVAGNDAGGRQTEGSDILLAPRLNLSSGVWIGRRLKGSPGASHEVEAFLGVRYAEPPVGELRFRLPVAKAYTAGDQDATTLGPPCIQGRSFYIRPDVFFHFDNTSEDCLHLNIYRPSNATDSPVLVYYYGGSFLAGFNGMFIQDPEELVARHDVIVVTVNYRVALFGFLNLNSSDAPGNQGLHDALLALKFVRDNARALGADSSRVTAWGQSAGAFLVGFLMSSPRSKGLFRRAILQSGSPMAAANSVRLNSFNSGAAAASVVGCVDANRLPEDQIEHMVRCMRAVNGHQLFRAVDEGLGERYTITFQPQYGIDDLVPDYPFPSNASRVHLNSDVNEVLISTVENEGAMFTAGVLERFQFGESRDVEDYVALSRLSLKLVLEMPIEYVRDSTLHYIPVANRPNIDALRDGMSRLYGDLLFECPVDYYARLLASRGVKVYRYLWDERPANSYWPEYARATHSDDIMFTSGALLHSAQKASESGQASDALVRFLKTPIPHQQQQLVYKSLEMIAAFARDGVPARPGGNAWPLYTEHEARTVRIKSEGFSEFVGPRTQDCPLWKDYFTNRTPAPASRSAVARTRGDKASQLARPAAPGGPERAVSSTAQAIDARSTTLVSLLSLICTLCTLASSG